MQKKLMRISREQLQIAKKLRQAGEGWDNIAKAAGASSRAIREHARRVGWTAKGQPAKKQLAAGNQNGGPPAAIVEASLAGLGEMVKGRLAGDIQNSIAALESWEPGGLELSQLEKRERIADSVQKRAAVLFDIGQTESPVVNIAVLSQLPDSVNVSAASN